MCGKGAGVGDLLEIQYVGSLADSGQVFDGTQIKVNGRDVLRGGDNSLFFVLGQQPVGQFPPAWDASLGGMCAGEERSVLVPPSLGYGAKGLPRRGIPPNASLKYEVRLISINGDATPR